MSELTFGRAVGPARLSRDRQSGPDMGGAIRNPAHYGGVFGHKSWGLPIGVQIIGPELGDLKTIGLARQLQEARLGFTPPGYC